MLVFIDDDEYLFMAAGNLKGIDCDFSEIAKAMRCSSLWYSAVIILYVFRVGSYASSFESLRGGSKYC